MDYERAKQVRDVLASVVSEASAAVNAFPKGPNGMMTDEVKFSSECVAAKTRYVSAFQELQKFNQRFVKEFAKEIREERRERYANT